MNTFSNNTMRKFTRCIGCVLQFEYCYVPMCHEFMKHQVFVPLTNIILNQISYQFMFLVRKNNKSSKYENTCNDIDSKNYSGFN